jgi:hypothetical protein
VEEAKAQAGLWSQGKKEEIFCRISTQKFEKLMAGYD